MVMKPIFGIGAELKKEPEGIRVEKITPGGPADRDKRLKPGDLIIAVGQGDAKPVDIKSYSLRKAISLITGKKGTKVKLIVIPVKQGPGAKPIEIDLIRDII